MASTPKISRRSLRADATRGDPVSQFLLGGIHDLDEPRSGRLARRWYLAAAKQGLREAQYGIATLYEEAGDDAQAVHWYRLSAEQGSRDARIALAWYRRASKNGNAAAMSNIGRMYGDGDVVEQSWSQAIIWFRKAAARGNVEAMGCLGRVFDGDESYPENRGAAVRWLSRAACGANQDK